MVVNTNANMYSIGCAARSLCREHGYDGFALKYRAEVRNDVRAEPQDSERQDASQRTIDVGVSDTEGLPLLRTRSAGTAQRMWRCLLSIFTTVPSSVCLSDNTIHKPVDSAEVRMRSRLALTPTYGPLIENERAICEGMVRSHRSAEGLLRSPRERCSRRQTSQFH
ncbi:hypothetical protein BD413DRAFT_227976 [Trametes elegans]|nr:hypothetical protein BD413DRAFT_227976 [Trametes elegans]